MSEETEKCVDNLLLQVVLQGWGTEKGTIDTKALTIVARAVEYLAERGLVEITGEYSDRWLEAVPTAPEDWSVYDDGCDGDKGR